MLMIPHTVPLTQPFDVDRLGEMLSLIHKYLVREFPGIAGNLFRAYHPESS